MFKCQLQELCQRRKWALPEYAVARDGPDHNPRFRASVSVNGTQFNSADPVKSSKEAQNKAAQVAFEHLAAAAPPATRAPRAPPSSLPSLVLLEKQVSYKCQLQNYAQKRNKKLPDYTSSIEDASDIPRFKATVKFDGQTFESPKYCNTIKEAEQAAARVALMSLPLDGSQQDDCGFYKNLLQESAQKQGFSLPKYNTIWNGQCHMPRFSSIVEIQGECFEGDAASTKKQAEINAAKKAWDHLKKPELEPAAQVSDSELVLRIHKSLTLYVPMCDNIDKKDSLAADNDATISLDLVGIIPDDQKSNSPSENMDPESSYYHQSVILPLEQINLKKNDVLDSVQCLQPVTAAKNEDTIEDMTTGDGSSSSPTSVCSHTTSAATDNENLEEGERLVGIIPDDQKSNSPYGNMDAESSYYHQLVILPLQQINLKKNDMLDSVQCLQPVTAAKNEDTVEDMTTEDGSSSSAMSVCSDPTSAATDNENLKEEGERPLLSYRVQVYSRKPDIVFPEGVAVLPLSSDKWVVVSLDFSSKEGVMPV